MGFRGHDATESLGTSGVLVTLVSIAAVLGYACIPLLRQHIPLPSNASILELSELRSR
jgi:hypothetical protein